MIADYLGLIRALLPELSLVIGALLVLSFDLLAGRGRPNDERLRAASAIGVLAIIFAVYNVARTGAIGSVFGGSFTLDVIAMAARMGVLLLTFFTLTIAAGTARVRHPAEFVALILFATAGFTIMAAAQQLLVVFLGVELASISLYVLAGFDKSRPESAEAALKYFLFGGMAAAFLLFGFSLLYGLTGTIDLAMISRTLQSAPPSGPLLSVALVMIVVAFGFKAAAAPFHLWAPDVYQGAPVSSASLIASGSKLAGIVVFARLFWSGLTPAAGNVEVSSGPGGWLNVLLVLVAVSLVVGNLVALAQIKLRRLLAYSAIGHAGAMLLGVMVVQRAGFGPVFYYALTYGLAIVGVFGVIAVIERANGRCEDIADLAGLWRRSPLLAGCLAVNVLSLAGIPPLAGFFGKFAVFAAALRSAGATSPLGVVTILAILISAVALYYYLLILKQAWVVRPKSDGARIKVGFDTAAPLVVTTALVIALGIVPSAILRLF
jgi:NADH-quinone oxidoreductase subunit N